MAIPDISCNDFDKNVSVNHVIVYRRVLDCSLQQNSIERCAPFAAHHPYSRLPISAAPTTSAAIPTFLRLQVSSFGYEIYDVHMPHSIPLPKEGVKREKIRRYIALTYHSLQRRAMRNEPCVKCGVVGGGFADRSETAPDNTAY